MKENRPISSSPICLAIAVASLGFHMAGTVSAAHPLDSLETRYPLPILQELNNAAFGNGTWVIVGNSGAVLTSADATDWVVGGAGTSLNLKDVIFVNNMFVAVGSTRCFTSPNGIDWTETASGLGGNDAGIAFGDGLYVIAGTFGNLRYSTDLINWTVQDPGHTTHFYGIAFAAGRFVAVGNGGTITQGAIGENWVTTNPVTTRLNDVAFGNNMFVVSGHSGAILTSSDGINWTDQGSIGSSALFSIKYGGGVFIASGNYTGNPTPYAIYRSTNGTDWNGVEATRLSDFIDGGGYGDGKFVLLGRNFIETSTDGLNWEFTSDPPMFVPRWAEYVNGKFIGALTGSIYGDVGTSDDGVVWTAQDSSPTGFTGSHVDATSDAERFFVCGRNNQTFEGYIITTQNGVDWSLAYSSGTGIGFTGGIWGVDYSNGKYLACGENGRILFSADGLTWDEKRYLGTRQQLRGMAYGANLYVVVGDDGIILTSTDGTDWLTRDSGVTSNLEDIAFHNNRFVAVANNSTTMITSTDGINWSEIGTTTTSSPRRIKIVNGEFVVPRFVSADGVTWEQHSFGGDVVYDGSNYFTFGGTIRSSSGVVPDLMIDSILGQNGNIIIEWTSGGVLQSRPGFSAGDWGDVSGATSPHQFDASANLIEVFRLRSE